MANTRELILRFSGDPRQLRQTMAALRSELAQFGQGQVATAQGVVRQTQQIEQRRIAETIRAANQRLREEQRAAREVARITAETARQAAAQQRIAERAAKQLADVRIREAKRAAKELERSLGQGGGGLNLGGLTSVLGQVPALSGVTSQLTALTSATATAGAATGGLAIPIGIAIAAFTAEAAAVAAVTHGLFDLAKRTADFQGKLFDISQQVGVSVETLSTLEILAATTGGSIETVAASLAIFQKNLEAAEDPTSREAKLLKDLGVTATDTEEALAQVIRGLFEMGEGSAQTAASMELFGRSGRFINAILKESNGDLEEAKRRFGELGIVISTESAEASDQFNDNMAVIQFQLRALTAEIGNAVIPIIIKGFKELQRILKDNKEAFEFLGQAAKGLSVVIGAPLLSALQGAGLVLKAHIVFVNAVADAYERAAAAAQLLTGNIPEVDPNAIPAQSTAQGATDGVKLLQDLQKAVLAKQAQEKALLKPLTADALKKFFGFDKEELKGAVDPAVSLLRQLRGELNRLTGETKAQEIAAQLLDGQYKNTSVVLREQILTIAEMIDMKRAAAAADQLAAQMAAKNAQETQAARDSLTAFLVQQAETLRQLKFGDKTAVQEAEEFIALFPKWTGAMMETEKFSESFWLRFNAHIIDSTRRMKEMIELMRNTADLIPAPGTVPEGVPNIPIEEQIGLPPPPDLSPWFEAFRTLKEIGADAMQSLAFAVGDLVQQFVLFGTTGPGALRKIVASVLAGVAAQAATLAVMETAYGIAALTPWGAAIYGPAPIHFKAAALFGAVALGTGLLGRSIAGNTFQQGSGGGGAGSGAQQGPPQPLQTIVQGRNQPLRVEVILKSDLRELDRVISASVVRNIGDGGELREIVQTDRR